MSAKLKKLIEQLTDQVLAEKKLVMASTDGTESTLTSDQKMQVQKATANGDTVEVIKKGDQIQESIYSDINDAKDKILNVAYIKSGKTESFKITLIDHDYPAYIDSKKRVIVSKLNGTKAAFFLLPTQHNNEDPNNSIKPVDEDTKKYLASLAKLKHALNTHDKHPASKEMSEKLSENISEDNIQEAKNVTHVKQLVHDAAEELEQLISSANENPRYARYAQAALKHLDNAQDCLDDVKMLEEKAAAKVAAQQDKDSTKHADQVKKHLGKKLKDKKDLEPIMKKYHPVAKKLASQIKDPAKTADFIWKHILKEGLLK